MLAAYSAHLRSERHASPHTIRGYVTDLRQFLAFPMYASAVWMIWVLTQQTGADGVIVGTRLVRAAGEEPDAVAEVLGELAAALARPR